MFGDTRRPFSSPSQLGNFRLALEGSANNSTSRQTGYSFNPNYEPRASTPRHRPSTYHGPNSTFRVTEPRQLNQDHEQTSNDTSSRAASTSTDDTLALDPDHVPECIVDAENALAELRGEFNPVSMVSLRH